MKLGTLGLAVFAVALSGCLGAQEPTDGAAADDTAVAPHTQTETEACFRNRGASVQTLRPLDAQLRALRDLAQRRSVEVHLDGALMGAAFAPDVAGAELLVELLQVPNTQYEIARRGNVVVLYRPGDDSAFQVVSACLRS